MLLYKCARCGVEHAAQRYKREMLLRPPCAWYCSDCRAVPQNVRISGFTYQDRNFILKRFLGFETYAEYLKSPLWRAIRADVFKAKGQACFLCGDRATQAHHSRYHLNDLVGGRLHFISPVCEPCHVKLEFDASMGKKFDLRAMKRDFRNKRKSHFRNGGAA